ncbi:YciI-like protein [Candidatus Terasakiella magnetica]|nr:YciI-like protein [Candidatus Terasakiella magnetica]
MFVVHCKDKPGHLQTRLDNRAAHLDFIKANIEKIVVAGPLQTEDRQSMVGSLLIIDIAERADLEAFLAADPYAKAGLFESVTATPYKKVFP